MSRKGLNIYKRKDGRWEARYIKSRTAQGKPLYGYLYASSYHEARNRLQDVIRLQGNAPNSKEMSKGSVFEFFSIEWLDTFSTSFKESTYAYILLDGGNYYIVDNNTQNHTYLNERRLEPSKPTLFHAGDTIRMADVVFNVIMGS